MEEHLEIKTRLKERVCAISAGKIVLGLQI